MTLREKLEIKWIQFTVHPSGKERAIPFKESIKNARRILMLLPSGILAADEKQNWKLFEELFSQKEIVGIFPGNANLGSNESSKMTSVFLNMEKLSLSKYQKSDALSRVTQKPFDLLIDLTTQPNTLGPYLCRVSKAPLRICVGANPFKSFYNLEYNGTDWNGLSKFLKNLIA